MIFNGPRSYAGINREGDIPNFPVSSRPSLPREKEMIFYGKQQHSIGEKG